MVMWFCGLLTDYISIESLAMLYFTQTCVIVSLDYLSCLQATLLQYINIYMHGQHKCSRNVLYRVLYKFSPRNIIHIYISINVDARKLVVKYMCDHYLKLSNIKYVRAWNGDGWSCAFYRLVQIRYAPNAGKQCATESQYTD